MDWKDPADSIALQRTLDPKLIASYSWNVVVGETAFVGDGKSSLRCEH